MVNFGLLRFENQPFYVYAKNVYFSDVFLHFGNLKFENVLDYQNIIRVRIKML